MGWVHRSTDRRGRALEKDVAVDLVRGRLSQELEEINFTKHKTVLERMEKFYQRHGSNLENKDSRRPRVTVVYRTLMKTRFQRGVKYTGGRGQIEWYQK